MSVDPTPYIRPFCDSLHCGRWGTPPTKLAKVAPQRTKALSTGGSKWCKASKQMRSGFLHKCKGHRCLDRTAKAARSCEGLNAGAGQSANITHIGGKRCWPCTAFIRIFRLSRCPRCNSDLRCSSTRSSSVCTFSVPAELQRYKLTYNLPWGSGIDPNQYCKKNID